MEYTHEEAVVDGVNVGYDVYKIDTQVSKQGAALTSAPGFFVPRRDRATRKKRLAELDDDVIYEASALDRDVVNESQMRLVIKTFRDRLFTEIFPGRTEVPKTLVFAKTDLDADDLTRIIREEFGKGNDFCQKITSKTTGKKPDELLNEFRNFYNPRVAVTVDMIATGTDVKPLECLLFMRNINSASYFEQMKGRGVRVIKGDDELFTPIRDTVSSMARGHAFLNISSRPASCVYFLFLIFNQVTASQSYSPFASFATIPSMSAWHTRLKSPTPWRLM